MQNLYEDQFWNQPLINSSIWDGAAVIAFASHQGGLGSIFTWAEFVVGSRLARRVFLRVLRFSPSTKTSIPKF